jgi:hypothetical protein
VAVAEDVLPIKSEEEEEVIEFIAARQSTMTQQKIAGSHLADSNVSGYNMISFGVLITHLMASGFTSWIRICPMH